MYVTDEVQLAVLVINLNTSQVVDRIRMPKAPYGIAMDPAADIAYVAVAGEGLFAIDGQTSKVTAKITLGEDAWGVTTDPATGQAFVSNPNENTVTVVNGQAGTVAGSVPTTGRQLPTPRPPATAGSCAMRETRPAATGWEIRHHSILKSDLERRRYCG